MMISYEASRGTKPLIFSRGEESIECYRVIKYNSTDFPNEKLKAAFDYTVDLLSSPTNLSILEIRHGIEQHIIEVFDDYSDIYFSPMLIEKIKGDSKLKKFNVCKKAAGYPLFAIIETDFKTYTDHFSYELSPPF